MMRPRPIDRQSVETEARAKCSWGDSREEVLSFMVVRGIGRDEATELVDEMFAERAATVRGKGVVKIVVGAVLMVIPVAAWIFFMSVGWIYTKLFALTIMVGLYGSYCLIKGIFMMVSPKSEPGDVADQ